MAEAGRGGGGFRGGAGHIGGSAFRGGNIHVGGGSVGKFHTNPGGKYVGGGVGKFHTNPGGKYVYRGSGSRFHTNPGGKYAYRGWSGKYDNHHHYGHYRRYGYPFAHGLVSPGCTVTVCTLRFAALRGFPRCHETPKCLWWATFCAQSDGTVNAARATQALRSATIGAGSTKDQQTP